MAAANNREGAHLRNPKYYIDRELSWLEFNERVLEEALDSNTPLLEQLKFLGIVSSNLDEFFMIRVGGIQEQIQAGVRSLTLSGITPQEEFLAVHHRAHQQVDRQYRYFTEKVLPAIGEEGIHIDPVAELPRPAAKYVRDFFQRELFPILTPLAVDSGHPFPKLRNLSLNLAVRLRPPKDFLRGEEQFALVQVPSSIPRLVRVPAPGEKIRFCLLEDIIADEVRALFPGLEVIECVPFRLTRDADIEFAEEEAEDLLKTVEADLRQRERGSVVRIELEAKASPDVYQFLLESLSLRHEQVYRVAGPLDLADLMKIAQAEGRAHLRDEPFTPAQRPPFDKLENVFASIARQDVLLHHPYESFTPVVEFVRQAAEDPEVLAIKMTLYRTSGDSPIVKALMAAAENGKQVAALVELKARFDESNNIVWARAMERSGVHVVYGLVGLKTHCKVALVMRREGGRIVRYLHLGTGNYNPVTARLYTDLGLLTRDPDLCDDATELFNQLTGYSRVPRYKKMVVAPMKLKTRILELIDEEAEKAEAGKPARIRAKMNALVDQDVIVALYKASQRGVPIDLIVRGICCLRPGLEGVSENIRVHSIVDRFLEHTRLFIFGEGEDVNAFISSADWMPRNLLKRVETMIPIVEPALRQRLIDEVFALSLADNMKRRILLPNGTYVRPSLAKGERRIRSQAAFIELEERLEKLREDASVDRHRRDLADERGTPPLRAMEESSHGGGLPPSPPLEPGDSHDSEDNQAIMLSAVSPKNGQSRAAKAAKAKAKRARRAARQAEELADAAAAADAQSAETPEPKPRRRRTTAKAEAS